MNDGGMEANRLPQKSSGHPVDRYVGQKIRQRRMVLGLSQTDLGAKVGITFQQIQKYERGSNRVSASKLYDMAGVLAVPVSYFFDGLSDPGTPLDTITIEAADDREAYATSAEGRQLTGAMNGLPKPLRSKIVAMVMALGGQNAGASEDRVLEQSNAVEG